MIFLLLKFKFTYKIMGAHGLFNRYYYNVKNLAPSPTTALPGPLLMPAFPGSAHFSFCIMCILLHSSH